MYTPSGQSRVYQVTQSCTDRAHCRESTGTGPVVLKVVPATGAALAGHHGPINVPFFFHTHYWYEVVTLKIGTYRCRSIDKVRYCYFNEGNLQVILPHLVPSPSEIWFRGMSVGGSFRRVGVGPGSTSRDAAN